MLIYSVFLLSSPPVFNNNVTKIINPIIIPITEKTPAYVYEFLSINRPKKNPKNASIIIINIPCVTIAYTLVNFLNFIILYQINGLHNRLSLELYNLVHLISHLTKQYIFEYLDVHLLMPSHLQVRPLSIQT